MSRIGKKPIPLPKEVKVSLQGGELQAEGPKGKLTLRIDPSVEVNLNENEIICTIRDKTQPNSKARFGLVRSQIFNMVYGCSKGFTKELEVVGVGYRAQVKGKELELSLGFSHPVKYPIPDGINIKVDKQNKIIVEGTDRQLVGQTAAEIRDYRHPEPYKGKGVKYAGEVIRRKAGKAAATTGAG